MSDSHHQVKTENFQPNTLKLPKHISLHKVHNLGLNISTLVFFPSLGRESLGIPREHGGLPDVVQTKVEHRYAFQPNAATGVRFTSVPLHATDEGIS